MYSLLVPCRAQGRRWCYIHSVRFLVTYLSCVHMYNAYLERDFGADRGDEYANLVPLVVDLVRTPAVIYDRRSNGGRREVRGVRNYSWEQNRQCVWA